MKPLFVLIMTLFAGAAAQADVSFNEMRGLPRGPFTFQERFNSEYIMVRDPGANIRCVTYGMPNGGGFNFPYLVRANNGEEAVKRVDQLLEEGFKDERTINFELKDYEILCETTDLTS